MNAVMAVEAPRVARMAEDQAARAELGAEISRRREHHGMSPTSLAKIADVTRGTVYQVEKGKSRLRTAHQVMRALEEWEAEYATDSQGRPAADSLDGSGLVTFRLKGNFGVDVTVQGPVGSMEELEQQVERLLLRMQEGSDRPLDET